MRNVDDESVQFLLSTVGNRIIDACKAAAAFPIDSSVLICHQSPPDSILNPRVGEIPRSESSRVRVVRQDGIGLSRSRNLLLAEADADIAILSDDDVEYTKDAVAIMRDSFSRHPEAALISFARVGEAGKRSGRVGHSTLHSQISILGMSSIVTAFRPRHVRAVGVRFDERFGLGARWRLGEEAVFASDCLAAGLVLVQDSREIVTHYGESSGRRWDSSGYYARGAVFARVFGARKGASLGVAFLLKNWRKASSSTSALVATREFWRGFKECVEEAGS